MKLFKLLTACFLCTLFSPSAKAQSPTGSAPGGHFSTSGGRTFWMGANYRKEWNTPITVPVLNLNTEHGGLTPVKRGGGKQTKSLRLADPKGREYTLRSIAKFITSKTLPGDLQSEAAADLVSDGVSASYPYAALSIPILAEAAGIPHGTAKVVMIPDDPKLGEFRKDFAGILALYEERLPDSVDKGYNTEEVVEKLEKDNDNDVDQLALLKIRILDMFVMDLDRHEGQWTWGAYENGKGKVFYPLAKDRDQAFYINQGLLPGFIKGRSLVPQLEGFKAEAKSIERFNFAARNFDRFFLNQLTEADWKKSVDDFLAKMTDDVIDRAMAQQPAEIRDISSKKIAETLKARRQFLAAEVMEYYHFLSEIVSVTGSDKKEKYDITKNDDGSMWLQVFKVDKDGNVQQKMYDRKFLPLTTKEVRIYGFDGDDQFVLHGGDDKIKVRLIGGGGQDLYENSVKSKNVQVYDRADGNNTIKGLFKNRMTNDSTVNNFNWVYYKYPFQSVFGTLGFNPDDGVSLGPTFKFIRHGFRKVPFKSMHQFKFSYAFSTKAVNAKYHNEFISVLGKDMDIVGDFEYKGPNNTSNFFGYGMNSVYDKTNTGKFRYYRIRYDLGDFNIQIRQRFSDIVSLSFGPSFQIYSLDTTDELNKVRNVVVNPLSGLSSSVFQRQTYAGARLTFTVDSRNSQALPTKGVNWITTFRHMAGIKKPYSYKSVTQLSTELSAYFELIPDRLVFADRIGGGITLGEQGYEFFQAQYLGSDEYLRGYRKERFAGKAKFYNQAELRLKLANLKTYLFPAAFGIYGFFDAGRVWVKDDNINKMGSGYGGGIWFSPLKKIVFTLSYAISKEDKLPLFGMGWKF